MVTFHARRRRNRGAWLTALVQDQAKVTQTDAEELEELTSLMAGEAHALIALDNPGPARAYALLVPHESGRIFARMHALKGTVDEGYRALFSQVALQARLLPPVARPGEVRTVFIDTSTLAGHVREAVEKLGQPYGLDFIKDGEPKSGEDSSVGEARVDAKAKTDPETEQMAEGAGEVAEDEEDGQAVSEDDLDDLRAQLRERGHDGRRIRSKTRDELVALLNEEV